MGVRQCIADYSRGNSLRVFWWLYRRQASAKSKPARDIFGYFMCRSAHRHGGYVGNGAVIEGEPCLPHGLHGVFISRYAVVGAGCRIYQNVTIGEIDRRAPKIGAGCLIGAGAVLVGGITVGQGAKIGAGAVVCRDVPPHCTVVAQSPRYIINNAEREA